MLKVNAESQQIICQREANGGQTLTGHFKGLQAHSYLQPDLDSLNVREFASIKKTKLLTFTTHRLQGVDVLNIQQILCVKI